MTTLLSLYFGLYAGITYTNNAVAHISTNVYSCQCFVVSTAASILYPYCCLQMHPTLPCIDEQNPLYCPLVSAAAFLRSVRRKSKIRPQRRKNEYRVQSFARILERSIALDSSNSSGDDSDSDRRLAPLTCLPSKFDDKNDARSFRIIPGCSDDDALGFSYPIPSWEHEEEEDYDSPLPNGTPWIRSMRDQVLGVRSRVRPSEGVKRKRKRTSFSDILGPPRYARSIQSVHESSFDITLKPEKLSFAGASGSSDKVNLALKTDHVGWEEERPSVLEIRIKELEGAERVVLVVLKA